MGGPQSPATSSPDADAVGETVGGHDDAAERNERELSSAADSSSGPEKADGPDSGHE
jgi:hypothetical protein